MQKIGIFLPHISHLATVLGMFRKYANLSESKVVLDKVPHTKAIASFTDDSVNIFTAEMYFIVYTPGPTNFQSQLYDAEYLGLDLYINLELTFGNKSFVNVGDVVICTKSELAKGHEFIPKEPIIDLVRKVVDKNTWKGRETIEKKLTRDQQKNYIIRAVYEFFIIGKTSKWCLAECFDHDIAFVKQPVFEERMGNQQWQSILSDMRYENKISYVDGKWTIADKYLEEIKANPNFGSPEIIEHKTTVHYGDTGSGDFNKMNSLASDQHSATLYFCMEKKKSFAISLLVIDSFEYVQRVSSELSNLDTLCVQSATSIAIEICKQFCKEKKPPVMEYV